jgi:hypothetical protein
VITTIPMETLRLVSSFERCTLPKGSWTHEAHLTMGLWYTLHRPPEAALDAMRAGIHRLNQAHGVVSTPTSGYHETITRAYMRLIGVLVSEDAGDGDWDALAGSVIERLGSRDALLGHWSRERLMSPAARAAWMEPDIRPLPAVGR